MLFRSWPEHREVTEPHTPFMSAGFLRFLAGVKARQERARYSTYVVASACKMVTLFVCMMVIWAARGESVPNLYNMFGESFGPHSISVFEVRQLEGKTKRTNENNVVMTFRQIGPMRAC